MRAAIISALAASALLSGCVTTMGQAVRPSSDKPGEKPNQLGLFGSLPQIKIPSVFAPSEIALNFDAGSQSFGDSEGRFAESFIAIPNAVRGSKEQRETVEQMSKIGASLGRSRNLDAYLYVHPSLAGDPAVREYADTLSRAGAGDRAALKVDPRMRTDMVLLWVRSPYAAAPDALVSADKRGLVRK